MKTSIVLIFIIVLAIFLNGQSGCQKQQQLSFDTNGLEMNFVSEAPPMEISVGEEFPIYVDIENKGGALIPRNKAEIYLSGIGTSITGVETKKTNENVLTEKTEIVKGGKERIKFAEKALSNLELETSFPLTLQLTSCYDYYTITQTSLCIGKGRICSISGEKIKENSSTAAPVQITSMIEEIRGKKLYVIFNIKNLGKGGVYSPDVDCDKLQEGNVNEKLKENEIWIDVITEPGFRCSLRNRNTGEPIEALSGKISLGKVSCYKKITGEAHLSPIKITLNYKYRQSKTRQITILPE